MSNTTYDYDDDDIWTVEAPSESDTGGWQPIPDGSILEAKLVALKTVEKPYKDDVTGEPVKRREFTFVITSEGPYKGYNVKGETSTKVVAHPDCKFWAWSSQILNMDLKSGTQITKDLLIGNDCRVQVKSEEKEGRKGKWWKQTVVDVLFARPAEDSDPVDAYSGFGDEEPF